MTIFRGNNYYTGIGSRDTPPDILKLMSRIASRLQEMGYVLRSGGADGADKAFEEGSGGICNIYLPWRGFNKSKSRLYFISDKAQEIASKFHPAWDNLKDSAKLLHSRNVYQVLGHDLCTPSKFVICWTRDGNFSGGTGQALRIAAHYNIPIFNLFSHLDRERLTNFVEN